MTLKIGCILRAPRLSSGRAAPVRTASCHVCKPA